MAKKQSAVLELEPPVDAIPEPLAEIPAARPVYKPMTSADVAALADKLIQSQEAADRILMAWAAGGERTGAQITVLRSVGLENPFELQREVDKRKSIIQQQQMAGTREQRAALASEIAAAEAIRAEQLPAIRQELEDTVKRLQTKINAIESAVSVPSGKLKTMNTAVDNLRAVRVSSTVCSGSIQHPENSSENCIPGTEPGTVGRSWAERPIGAAREVPVDGRIADIHSHPAKNLLNQLKLWPPGAVHGVADMEGLRKVVSEIKAELANAKKIAAEQLPEAERRLAEIEWARDYYVL